MSAKGEYFVIFGAHDKNSENYIEALLNTIIENPDSSIAMGKTCVFDFKGNNFTQKNSLISTSGLSKSAKFQTLMFQNQNYIYGLINRKYFLGCMHINPPYNPGTYELILQELLSKGDIIINTEVTWFRYQNRLKENPVQQLKRYRYKVPCGRKQRLIFDCFPNLQYMISYFLLPFRRYSFKTSLAIIFITLPHLILKTFIAAIIDLRYGLHLLTNFMK